ncbi:MAG: bifunctional metallophosphatase/5'-nucleotidase [bacterium]|nr:bifunctional metallophosphatase/5'-nucleotidase [bacterium]
MRSIFQFFLYAVLLLSISPSAALQAQEIAPEPDLVIAHTSDLHAHYRSFTGRNDEVRGGCARLAYRINEIRNRDKERFLYFDTGDLFQGTPFYNFYRGALGLEILERMGCDALALGNHELDDGSLNLLRMSLSIPFPVLCGNLSYPDGAPLLPSSTLFEINGLRIAVLGLISGSMPELAGECSSGALLTTPPAAALTEWLAGEDVANSDLQILLSHCGLDEDRGLAQVPLILGGHSHSFMSEPEMVGETAIIHSGCYGYRLGIIECFRRDDGGWRFAYRYEDVTEDWPEDPAIAQLIADAGKVVDREMDVVLATLPDAFETRGKSVHSNPLGRHIAEVMRRGAAADIGMQNTGGYRTWLPAGPVTRGKIFELLPFDNHLMKLVLTSETVQELFDYLAATHDSGRFSQIAGATYTINAGRATDIVIQGQPLEADREYTLATADFLYGGGDGYTCLAKAASAEILDDFARDLLIEDLLQNGAPLLSDYPPNFQVR